MSNSEDYIISLLQRDKRLDGRKLNEYRKPIKIETGISKNAEGSARVKIGETEVIAGIKLEVGEPFPDNPDEGTIIVNAELLPLSNPDFESGPPSAQATELARIVDRGIRESQAVDFKKLCIKKGEKVWIVFIDIYTVNDAGNLIDAAALASLVALKDAKFPKYDEKEGKINYEEHTKTALPLTKLPVTCTLVKIKDKILVDPDTKEEAVAEARLSIASLNGRIYAMQKGGNKGIKLEELNKMIDLGMQKGEELSKLLK